MVTFVFAFVLTRQVRAWPPRFGGFPPVISRSRLPVERRSVKRVGRLGRRLMLDFNQMGDRVGSLIHPQKTVVRDFSHELQIEREETDAIADP